MQDSEPHAKEEVILILKKYNWLDGLLFHYEFMIIINIDVVINNVNLFALSLWLQAAGADALELNLSCPHGMGERGMGLACGQVHVSVYVLS